MITEDYVSYEIAKLLEEKGFDEHCKGFYVNSGVLSHTLRNTNNSKWDEDKSTIGYISAPTLQMTLKWLREVHKLFIEICTDKAYNFKDIVFRVFVYDKELDCLWKSDNFSNYEEADEAAIKYCLKNLI